MYCGPVCHETKSPTGQLHELETRSRSNGNQCLSHQLDRSGGLCFPPVFTNRQMSSESEKRTEYGSASGTPVAEPDMVPNVARIDDRVSTALTQAEGHTKRFQRPAASIGMSQQAKTSRLKSLRQQQSAIDVSKETSELLLAGWSKGTNTAYQSGWKRWSSWCQRRKIDSISCRIQPFLLHCLKKAYSTAQLT